MTYRGLALEFVRAGRDPDGGKGRADANDGNGDSYSSLSFLTQAWITFGGYPPGLQLGGSTWIIATANVSAVPEPSTLTLALLGVVCLAVAHGMTRS
jgi:PEP-CTERM motif